MKYTIVYESSTGNTGKLAETIRTYLGGEQCLYFGAPVKDIPQADVIFAGFWTDKGDCPESLGKYLGELKGQKVFLFGTAGFGGDPEYFGRILGKVRMHLGNGNEVAGTFMCQGRMPDSVKKRYESMQEQNPGDEKIKAMIRNFDLALSHPDEADLAGLVKAVSELTDMKKER